MKNIKNIILYIIVIFILSIALGCLKYEGHNNSMSFYKKHKPVHSQELEQ